MASPPQEQPHLVSLVLQSKKALQNGEQLCSRAHAISNSSAKAAVDVLALDAKVRWVTNAVNEQLKLVAVVAKTIEEKRSGLASELQEWDNLKSQHMDSLDSVLESLGTQHVPPDFHSTGADSATSSLFGLQEPTSNEDPQDREHPSIDRDSERQEPSSSLNRISTSPTATIRPPHSPVLHSPARSRRGSYAGRNVQTSRHSNRMNDRSKWKTLRDFVDDAAIDQLYESIEEDRAQIEKTMSQTDQYPETLQTTIETIQSSLPSLVTTGASGELPPSASGLLSPLSPLANNPSAFIPPEPPASYGENVPTTYHPTIITLTSIITLQDNLSNEMAEQLQLLIAHYDNMAQSLQDSEQAHAGAGGSSPDGNVAGGTDLFSEEDLMEMNRDTEELPVILGELEDSCDAIEVQHEKLLALQRTSKTQLELLSQTITDLSSLGSIMEEMLSFQLSISTSASSALTALHERLDTLVHLKERYVSYQLAFNKLILELTRRKQYREAVEIVVTGMINQLIDMTNEENQVRQSFNSSYGLHLPEDICLCIGNAPTRWNVVTREGDEVWEYLPEVDDTLVTEARERIQSSMNDSGEEARQPLEEIRVESP